VHWLIDSSVLLRFFAEADPQHRAVTSKIEFLRDSNATICFTPQVARESWSVLTRPLEVGGFSLSVSKTAETLANAALIFQFLADTPAIYDQWLELVRLHSVSGRQVHDAYHVAAIMAHGLDGVITLDARDFKRYPDIQVLDPRSP
jgi:predicted nucleic acid-binding protein